MNRIVSALSVFMLLATVSSCAPVETIRVVDGEGDPVEGALVVSEQAPYYFQQWRLGAYITDKDGKAKVVADHGSIFKPGYFPLINASDLDKGAPSWRRFIYFSETTSIYPIRSEENTPIQSSQYITQYLVEKDPLLDKDTFIVPTDVCKSVRVTYNAETIQLKAESKNEDLLPSKRFYFVGASSKQSTSRIEKENEIAFYCNDNDEIHKVGMLVAFRSSRGGVREDYLNIFTAKVSSTDAYLQPDIKCMTEEDVALGTYKSPEENRQPKLYLSRGARAKISAFKDNIPCANENSDDFFDHIESFL